MNSYTSATAIANKAPLIGLSGIYQPAMTGSASKFASSTTSSGSTIKLEMIMESFGSDKLSPKDLDDQLDREIAAMTKEERLAAIYAMAGTWTDLGDETNQGWRFYDWDAPDDDQQIPV